MTEYQITQVEVGIPGTARQRRKKVRRLKWDYIKSAIKHMRTTYSAHAEQVPGGKWQVFVSAPGMTTPLRVGFFETEAKALECGFGVATGIAKKDGE